MKPGDIVQIAQADGKNPQWIYATALTVNDDGSVFVQVRHPGNIEHGETKFVPAKSVRVKSDLEKMITEIKPGPDTKKLREHLEIQAEHLS